MKVYTVIDLKMCKSDNKGYGYHQETIQIGAVKLDENFEIIDKLNIFVKPEYGNVDSFIEKLTGIIDYDLKTSISFNEAVEKLFNWIGSDENTFVSWSRSDAQQINREAKAKNILIKDIDKILNNWLDCQKMYGIKMNTKRAYSLHEAIIATDIKSLDNEHDGLADAYNTALIFKKVMTEEKLILNKEYEKAKNEEREALASPLGKLFKYLKLVFD